jgi:hypothetical protein
LVVTIIGITIERKLAQIVQVVTIGIGTGKSIISSQAFSSDPGFECGGGSAELCSPCKVTTPASAVGVKVRVSFFIGSTSLISGVPLNPTELRFYGPAQSYYDVQLLR